MGEFADALIDEIMSLEGSMEYSRPSLARCRYCNVSGLFWLSEGGKWRLYTSKGYAHKCKQYTQATNTVYDEWKLKEDKK